MFCAAAPFLALPLSVAGYYQCLRSGGTLKGAGFALAGIVLAALGILLVVCGVLAYFMSRS